MNPSLGQRVTLRACFAWVRPLLLASGLLVAAGLPALSANPGARTPADTALDRYFRAETERLATHAFAGIDSLTDWEARRTELRHQLLEMLGLWPLPDRTDLRPTITGQLERDGLVVERLHFQSLPGLYVTANLYRPREVPQPLPAILYVCGHAQVKTNGVSCGNKTAYQHHGIWFARHGYVCLVIDSVQLGEIEGLHHGTYRFGQWWWNSRGYTPAGVEAWNSIRALDYLGTRPDVDAQRLGMTGRSGGGSYTWTTAAIDDRVRVAAPVAGITDLRNHVVDGTVEGHCDCMFFANTYRWDFALDAALIAPRPLLVVNTDADTIFPLDGVERVHAALRRVYEWYGAATNLGLVIAPGPHKDTQDLQVPTFRWFNQKLRGTDPLIADPATPLFTPLELRVFTELPKDQRNTEVQSWFGSRPTPPAQPLPDLPALRKQLRERCFAGWPKDLPPPQASPTATLIRDSRPQPGADDLRVREWEFTSQPEVPLQLTLVTRGPATVAPERLVVRVLDAKSAAEWDPARAGEWLAASRPDTGVGTSASALAILQPRGIGIGSWTGDAARQVQIRRRFMLLGQTLDGMRVWDIRQGLRLARELLPSARRIELVADGAMAVNALYAAVFEPEIKGMKLSNLPASHREGPDYLNVLQVTDLPGTLALIRRSGIEVIP